ncbi:hypothetical protein ATSB10_38370 [Dyella thiooxydans]|uniref:Uncharacterized protein n=1 Tax=Dyella thiooxydans TaxID=445710 RepID=A0A160N587_9GAMM|nr:hypothetical protein [Dyella thiooxydans]AND71291.1 hypothetical protein ATSB10_38370 [Dyella thiooxydans]
MRDGLLGIVWFPVRDALWESVLFQLGRAGLLAITLGRFPRGRSLQHHADRISFAGVIVLVLGWLAWAACPPPRLIRLRNG